MQEPGGGNPSVCNQFIAQRDVVGDAQDEVVLIEQPAGNLIEQRDSRGPFAARAGVESRAIEVCELETRTRARGALRPGKLEVPRDDERIDVRSVYAADVAVESRRIGVGRIVLAQEVGTARAAAGLQTHFRPDGLGVVIDGVQSASRSASLA